MPLKALHSVVAPLRYSAAFRAGCSNREKSTSSLTKECVAVALIGLSRLIAVPTPSQDLIATEAGRPSSNIRFKTLHAINASAARPSTFAFAASRRRWSSFSRSARCAS